MIYTLKIQLCCDKAVLCDVDFDSSLAGVAVVSAAISGSTGFDWSDHLASLHVVSVSRRQSIESWYNEKLHEVLDQFPEVRQCAIKRAVENRICLGDMATMVMPQVIKEPIVREGDPASNDPGCILT